MTVRPAAETDAEALGALHVHAWQEAYRGQIPQARLDALDPAERAREWHNRLSNLPPAAAVYVVDDEAGVLAGFVSTLVHPDPATGRITAIYVRPDAWGRGTGRTLMAAGLEHLRAAGCTEAVLWVLATNERARRFYEAAGWHPDGATQTEDFDGVPLEELRYRRPL
ncbi:GNAT family N-acetyltransferase [Dactylosporangium sp. NPDC000244]|uniref:GNAT family N-acetyltransferase n=1 Tax=Dactylosporangium sp. NPDC000244 TaxID=3154365 RepID=UPI00332A5660